jgi:hypothetical protein
VAAFVNAWTDLLVLRVWFFFLTTAEDESSSSDVDDKCFVLVGRDEQASPNSLAHESQKTKADGSGWSL